MEIYPRLNWLVANCLRCRHPHTAEFLAFEFMPKYFWLIDGQCRDCRADLGQRLARSFNPYFIVLDEDRPEMTGQRDLACPKCLTPQFCRISRGWDIVAGLCSNAACQHFILPPAVQRTYELTRPMLLYLESTH